MWNCQGLLEKEVLRCCGLCRQCKQHNLMVQCLKHEYSTVVEEVENKTGGAEIIQLGFDK